MMNKRGQQVSGWQGIIIAIVLLALAVAVIWIIYSLVGQQVELDATSFISVWGNTGGKIADGVFGGIVTFADSDLMLTGPYSAIIITIAMWLLLLVTFADIIGTFSTFSRNTSWIIAIAITVIGANLKLIISLLSIFVGIFAFAGGIAVILGLGGAFLVFVAINLGIGSLGPWLMRRKAMKTAQSSAINAEAGGRVLAGAIRGMHNVGEALAGRRDN